MDIFSCIPPSDGSVKAVIFSPRDFPPPLLSPPLHESHLTTILRNIENCRRIFRIYFPRGNNFTFNLNSFKYQMSHSLPFHSFNFANFFLFWGPREQTNIFQQFHECFIIRMEKKLLKKVNTKIFCSLKSEGKMRIGKFPGFDLSIVRRSGIWRDDGCSSIEYITENIKINILIYMYLNSLNVTAFMQNTIICVFTSAVNHTFWTQHFFALSSFHIFVSYLPKSTVQHTVLDIMFFVWKLWKSVSVPMWYLVCLECYAPLHCISKFLV